VRAEVFVFVAAAFLCCVGLFTPVGQLDLTGRSIVRTTSISLFKLGNSKDDVREFLSGYRGSKTKKVGAVVLDKVSPHLRGRAASDAADVQEAMAALDQLRDEDIDKVGTFVAVVVWSLLVLNVLGAYLMLAAHPPSGRGRGRAIAGTITALFTSVIAVGVYVGLSRVVAEGNHELGRDMLSLRAGAYLVPIGAVGSLVAAITLMVSFVRHRR
jgi:hypothetical protein